MIISRPRIVLSKCLEHEACRYNGEMIRSAFVRTLMKHADFIPVCPEEAIGLGIPRDPIRIESAGGAQRLYQMSSATDLTDRMKRFSRNYLRGLKKIDGFIFKSRSPSCGVIDAKLFESGAEGKVIGKTAGLFAAAAVTRFPCIPVEDEERLTNRYLRDNFLRKLFLLAEWRKIHEKGGMRDIIIFQTKHKLTLMVFSKTQLQKMETLVASQAGLRLTEIKNRYRELLCRALTGMPRYKSTLTVLLQVADGFSGLLTTKEKTAFPDAMERYRRREIPLSVPVNMIHSRLKRFGEGYLHGQSIFNPYPHELMYPNGSEKRYRLE